MEGHERVTDRDDYQSVRQEILQWQGFRFTLFTASTAVVTGVLGFVLGSSEKKNSEQWVEQWWFVISVLLLVFLGCVALLTWFAGSGNVKMGTYIRVFYEEEAAGGGEPSKGWHVRHSDLETTSRPNSGKRLGNFQAKLLEWGDNQRLDRLLAFPYLLLGVASLFLPAFKAYTEGQQILPSVWWMLIMWMLIIVAACIWFGLWVLLLFLESPRWYYREKWDELKKRGIQEDQRRDDQ
jgi:protein-S-isoprenylcysteine O-methyltransferase Ste14